MLVKWHFLDGTQRFDEPVSKTTLKLWAGSPMLITPKYCVWKNHQLYNQRKETFL